MTWYIRFDKTLYKVEAIICSISLLLILFGMAGSVIIRFFNLQIPNTGELALAAASPLVFVGSAMCTKTFNHITIDAFDQYAKGKIKNAAHVFVAVIMIVFSVIYTFLSYELLSDAVMRGERWLDMGTPIYVPIFFYLFGMVCMAVHCLTNLFLSFGLKISD